MVMRNRKTFQNPDGFGKRIWSPLKSFRNVAMLTDDMIHHGVNKTANRIVERTGIKKKNLALGILGASLAAEIILFGLGDLLTAMLLIGIAVPLMSEANQYPNRQFEQKSEGEALSAKGAFSKIARRLFLVLGIGFSVASYYGKEIVQKASELFNHFAAPEMATRTIETLAGVAVYCLGASIFHYLASSSNGMLEKAKKALKTAYEALKARLKPAPTLVPIPISANRMLANEAQI